MWGATFASGHVADGDGGNWLWSLYEKEFQPFEFIGILDIIHGVTHVESTMKELNDRVKGTENFWSEFGGESVLQLRADSLSDSDPLEAFWRSRAETRSGFHACVGARKPRQST